MIWKDFGVQKGKIVWQNGLKQRSPIMNWNTWQLVTCAERRAINPESYLLSPACLLCVVLIVG